MCISQAANSIGLKEIPKFKVELGDEQDWITKNQESFQPVEIAERLWIVPEWTSPPVAEAVNIILNPGLAFGTGEHPTTKLCLLRLQSLIKGGEAFLDYGTGSGILAIAALKFGAASSAGVDIDPLAIKSATHNAALNSIPLEKLELHLAPSDNTEIPLRKEQFDVVIANILLNPVMELADHILSFAKPGATIGISGILSEQLPSVKERYSPFLEDISVATIGDWVCMSGTKKRS
ncbi:ribosomal protein L11 methyltransferase-related [Raphanus sativus]|nr:ribosomal protein L11 methyltransferase-related [Raphanus sativus]